MSSKISKHSSRASLAEDVKSLRDALGLSQEKFAKALGVKRLAVAMWEKEGKESYDPSVESRVRLAKLARNAVIHRPSEALLFSGYARRFWEHAGVDDDALRILVPELERSFKQFEKRLTERPEPGERELVHLPVIEEDLSGFDEDALTSRLHTLIREGVKTYAPFPSFMVPHPRATICVAAPDAYM